MDEGCNGWLTMMNSMVAADLVFFIGSFLILLLFKFYSLIDTSLYFKQVSVLFHAII